MRGLEYICLFLNDFLKDDQKEISDDFFFAFAQIRHSRKLLRLLKFIGNFVLLVDRKKTRNRNSESDLDENSFILSESITEEKVDKALFFSRFFNTIYLIMDSIATLTRFATGKDGSWLKRVRVLGYTSCVIGSPN